MLTCLRIDLEQGSETVRPVPEYCVIFNDGEENQRVKRSILIAGILILCIAGCAVYKPFMAPGFTGPGLTDGGLAIFPVLVGEGGRSAPGVETYCRSAGEDLATALRTAQPSLRVVGPTEVSATLATKGLVGDFAALKQTYAMTGMLDVKKAEAITKELGTKFFILASINSLYASTESTAVSEMSCKIWDSSDGQMVFEAVRTGEWVSIFSGPPYHKAVKQATEELTKSLMLIYQQQK